MAGEHEPLAGRTVLLTGGSGFLGQQWIAALIDAGAEVISVDIASTSEPAQARLRQERADLTNPAELVALKERLTADQITIDVLVNNAALDAPVGAAGLSSSGRFESFPLARWDAEIAVGLTAAFLCCQTFAPGMAERGRGIIVNVGSDLGLIAPDQRLYRQPGLADDEQPAKPVTYSVIKSGLIGLTRYLSTYWGDRGVRANTLCLGGVERNQDPAFKARLAERVPLGRMARQGEYGDAMVFLCSDASSYMTGATLVIDGGRTTW